MNLELMELFGILESNGFKQGVLPAQNFHLNNPIRPVDMMYALEIPLDSDAKISSRAKKDWENFRKFLPFTDKLISYNHASLLEVLGNIHTSVQVPGSFKSYFKRLISSAKFVYDCQKDVVTGFISDELKQPPSISFTTQEYALLESRYYVITILKQLVIMTASDHKTRWNNDQSKYFQVLEDKEAPQDNRAYYSSLPGLEIIAGKRYMFVKASNCSQDFLFSRDQLLLFQDSLYSRFILLLDGIISKKLGLLHHLTPQELDIIFAFGDQILKRMGNDGYNILAKWEALCVSTLLELEEDEYCDTTVFSENLMRDIREEAGDSIILDMILQIKDFLMQLASINLSKITQAHGLFRIWGHPIIDIIGGIRKLKMITQRPRTTNPTMIGIVQGTFKELFCTRYFQKYGRWPNLDLSGLSPTSYLRRKIENNEGLNKWDQSYNIRDWQLVKAKETYAIPDNIDLAEVLDDKSLSPPLSTVTKNIKRFGTIGIGDEKSVILSYLRTNLNSAKQLLHLVDEVGFPEDEKLVGVCPKEQESKINARHFGLLPLIKRLIVVITESLIGQYVLPLFPEITMLDDEATLKKRLLELTKEEKDIVKVVTNIDFEKWNSYMRREETIDIFKFLDGLFGLTKGGAIARTHEMFENSVLYLSDGSLLPPVLGKDILDSDISWRGHLGGIEGLRQKGWTLFTLILIHLAVSPFGVKFKLIGQGDNQVLVFYFEKSKFSSKLEIKMKHAEILKSLNEMLQQVGPPLKMEETWSSSSFFIYGKFPIWKGTPLSMSMKKGCKTYDISNEGIPTLETTLSSLAANTAASINADFYPWSQIFSYLFTLRGSLELYMKDSPINQNSLFSAINYETRSGSMLKYSVPNKGQVLHVESPLNPNLFLYKNNQIVDLSDLGYELLMMFPNTLGGLPIQLLGTFFAKGFPDPLTLDISLLKKIWQKLRNTGTKHCIYLINILSPRLSSVITYRMLFEDPVSLNLSRPSTPKELLKRKLAVYLIDNFQKLRIVNSQFLTFMRLSLKDKEEFYEALASSNPFNPRVFHKLLEATLQGQATRFLNKINGSGTMLKKYLASRRSHDPIDDIKRGEFNFLKSVLSQISTPGMSIWREDNCSTSWAAYLRAVSWEIPEARWEGVTVASPFEAFQGFLTKGTDCYNQEHPNPEIGYVLATPTFLSDPKDIDRFHVSLGCSVPYFGSKTVDKLSKATKQLVNESPNFLQSAIELQQFIGWGTSPNSELSNLIRALISALTNVDFSIAESVDNTIAGSVGHRIQDKATKKEGILPIMYNIPSNLSISTNTLVQYAKGSGNVNLYFQTLFLLIQSCWASSLYNNLQDLCHMSLHFHQSCMSCIRPINEELMELEKTLPWELYIDSNPGNPFCWLDKESFRTRRLKRTSPIENTCIIPQKTSKQRHLLNRILGQFLTQQITLGAQMGAKLNPDPRPFSVSWVFKSNIKAVFYESLYTMVCQYMYSSSINMSTNWSDVKNQLTGLIQTLGNNLGAILHPLIFNLPLMNHLAQWVTEEHTGLAIQHDMPTFGSLTDLIKRALQLCLADLPEYLKMMNFSNYNLAIVPDRIHTSPYWIELCRRFIISGSMDPELLVLIREARSLMRTDEENFGNTLNWKERATDIRLEGFHLSESFMLYLNSGNVKGCTIHPDSLAKLLPEVSYNLESRGHYMDLATDFSETSKVLISSHHISPFVARNLTILNFCHSPPLEFGYIGSTGHWAPPRVPLGQSAAPLKLASIIPLSYMASEKFLMCGDGAGGYSFIALLTNPGRQVWFNTLIKSDGILPHSLGNFVPTYFYGWPSLLRRILNQGRIGETPSDLLSEGFHNSIRNYCDETRTRFDALICDAEGISWSDRTKELTLISTLLRLGQELDIKKCVIKIYAGEGDWLKVVSAITCCYYEEFEIRRSYFSSIDNSELFLIAGGARDTPLDHPSTENATIVFKNLLIDFTKFPSISNPCEISVGNNSARLCLTLARKFFNFITPSKVKNEVREILHTLQYVKVRKSSRVKFLDSFWNQYIKMINQRFPLRKFDQRNKKKRFRKNESFSFPTILSILKIYMTVLGQTLTWEEGNMLEYLEGANLYFLREGDIYVAGLTKQSAQLQRQHSKMIVSLDEFGSNSSTINAKRIIQYYTCSRMIESGYMGRVETTPFLHTNGTINSRGTSGPIRSEIGRKVGNTNWEDQQKALQELKASLMHGKPADS